jgi:hypothetical protein
MVTETGTQYRKSALRAQVRHRLAIAQADGPAGSVITPVTAASSTPAATQSSSAGNKHKAGKSPRARVVVPSVVLVGCVMRLTGGIAPRFVDRATYQGKPAYIIEANHEIWVVGVGCTAASPALITAVGLDSAD